MVSGSEQMELKGNDPVLPGRVRIVEVNFSFRSRPR